MRSAWGSAAAMALVALVVGPEARHDEVGALDERDGLEELAQAASTHDLAQVEDDAPLRRQAEPLGRAACRGRRRQASGSAVAIGDHRRVPDDGVHRAAQDALQHRGVRVADRDDRIGGTGEAALVATQQLLPGPRQARHAPGLAVDVVRVVDDAAPEALAKGDRQAERDDALRLPDVEGPDLVGDRARPTPATCSR